MKGIEIHCCAIEKSSMSFPMGALCIKTAINESGRLPEAMLFEHFIFEDPEEVASSAAERKPWAVGLSVYIWNSKWMTTFARCLKEKSPETLVFAGGPQMIDYLSSLPSWLDFAVLGEGEVTTVEALSRVHEGTPVDELRLDGLITRAWISPVNSPLPDLSKLSSPFLSGEAECIINEYDSVLWELTRGCPFACAFCFESRGNRSVRDYPFERIEKELEYLVAHGIRNVFVLDPTFNLNAERAKEILRLLVERSEGIHFTFEIRVELVDEEMADLFAELNCSLQIGLQSSDPAVVKAIGRKFDKELFASKAQLLASRGVPFGLDVIIGLPEDNITKFMSTIDFAVSMQPSNIDCFTLSLLPGTDLTRRAKELGLEDSGNEERTVFRTKTFNEGDFSLALSIKNGMDMFFTKGQSCMWIHAALEALGIRAHELFRLFDNWIKENGRSDEEDIWILQDEFIEEVFVRNGKEELLDAMKSFMELHQGISFVTDTCESAVVNLAYSLDDLSALDEMPLSEFVEKYPVKMESVTIAMGDDGLIFL